MAYHYTYELQSTDPLEFTFTSEGRKGKIKKVVTLDIFPVSNEIDAYNVLLEDEVDGVWKGDSLLSGNNDAIKVMNTVVEIIKEVLKREPLLPVFITGSDDKRQLVYTERALRDHAGFQVFGGLTRQGPFEDPGWLRL